MLCLLISAHHASGHCSTMSSARRDRRAPLASRRCCYSQPTISMHRSMQWLPLYLSSRRQLVLLPLMPRVSYIHLYARFQSEPTGKKRSDIYIYMRPMLSATIFTPTLLKLMMILIMIRRCSRGMLPLSHASPLAASFACFSNEIRRAVSNAC